MNISIHFERLWTNILDLPKLFSLGKYSLVKLFLLQSFTHFIIDPRQEKVIGQQDGRQKKITVVGRVIISPNI